MLLRSMRCNGKASSNEPANFPHWISDQEKQASARIDIFCKSKMDQWHNIHMKYNLACPMACV